MSDSETPDRVVFVSRFNRILAVVIWALCAFVVVATSLGDPTEGLIALAPAAVIALVDWILLWRPRVEATSDGVRLVNVLREVNVPWAALIHVDTKYALTLHTPGRKYAAWAAPAPGRAGAAVARRQARSGNVAPRATGPDGKAAPGDLVTTDSGAAADIVRARWEELRESGTLLIGEADVTPVSTRWLWPPAVAAVVVAAIAALVLQRS